MSGLIQVLPQSISNQIAAGEVVGRPASVVKELMENSIDANSTNIELFVSNGGKTLIQVVDNGSGMSKNDAKLCFQPHATSKIKAIEDIYNIRTMGFRGEALSSISSISHLELRTKNKDDKLGISIELQGGEIIEISPVGIEQGTSIAVKNLFFNVPARRNFLKSNNIENSHILNEFLRIALIYPEISFSYHNDSKLIHRVEPANFKKRIIDLFGKSFNERLIPIEEEVNEVKISGFISKANFARRNKRDQYFFVNKRFMRNYYFANAIERAYQGLITEKTYPIFFINLEVEPENIDVNIHPTKTEIKFLDEKLIYAVLHAAAKKSLGQFTLSSEIDFEQDQSFFATPLKKGELPKLPEVQTNPDFNPFEEKWFKPKTKATSQLEISNRENWEKFFEEDSKVEERLEIKQSNDSIQFRNKYIITKTTNSVFIIDQEKASERILFEQFSNNNYQNISSQQLLFPYNHFFSPQDSIKILELVPELREYGFVLKYQKDGSFNILGIPNNINIDEIEEVLEDLIKDLDSDISSTEPMENPSSRRYKMALSMSKRLSIKHGKELGNEEIQGLIGQLFSSNNCEVSPSGHKTMISFDKDGIDKLFG